LTTLYAEKIITDAISDFIAQTATAEATKKLKRMASNTIMGHHLAFIGNVGVCGNFQIGNQMAGNGVGYPYKDHNQYKLK
jgi:hypothetical protein